jgi:hypothetical protein
MKQLSLIMMAALVLASCKKSEESTTDTPLTSPGMNAKLDGTVTNFGVPAAQIQDGAGGTKTIYITGLTTEDTQVDVSLTRTGDLATGEFGEADGAHITVSDASGLYATNKIVNVKIIALDANHVVGSFIGEANPNAGGVPKSVTEGKFYANF